MSKIVEYEIIRSCLQYVVERMGTVLRRCAFSPNIRDRADLSCLVCDPEGRIVVQAEHIPVHLGSMHVGMFRFLKYIQEEGLEPEPGDVYVVNDPYIIGTHLNDVTVLKPVFYNGKLVAWLVNKAHHVDIGGAYPGGLCIHARTLFEEGLVIPPTKLIARGCLRKDILNMLLNNVRMPMYTYGDLHAQISACNIGEQELCKLCEKYGVETVFQCFNYIIEHTEALTRARVRELSGAGRGEDYVELNDKLVKICVELRFSKAEIHVDFSGTDPQLDCPLNAAFGVTTASVTFVLKSILFQDIEINHGFYNVVKIEAPEGTVVNPRRPAPVGLGNVETSQRIVDAVLEALSQIMPDKVPAQSGGTMTNVILAGPGWVFYETIGCGAGACPYMDGEDAVHVYMTNTLNTPIEVIERVIPVQFIEYSIRRGSGGSGRYRGGNGIVRCFKILDRAWLSVVMDRVKLRPRGRAGGEDGLPGQVQIIKRNGTVTLSGKTTVELEPGDIVRIETPGGGGFGRP